MVHFPYQTFSKWVITSVISGLTLFIPFITGVITHLLSGMNHQVQPAKKSTRRILQGVQYQPGAEALGAKLLEPLIGERRDGLVNFLWEDMII
jgi:hypothetical protein